jgi:hypothetical protein
MTLKEYLKSQHHPPEIQAKLEQLFGLAEKWTKDFPTGPFSRMDVDLEDMTLGKCAEELTKILD